MKQPERTFKWAILTTGWGRNATDTVQAYKVGKLKNSEIAVVIYENEPCGAAELAKKYGIETLQLVKADFPSLMSYQKQLALELTKRHIDFIFMLNYRYIIKKDILEAFPNRIINIHPSLLPSFSGTKTAIQDAINYGVKITGITTHIIDDKLDQGRILCQKCINIKKKDTFETLYPKFAKNGIALILKTIQLVEDNYFDIQPK